MINLRNTWNAVNFSELSGKCDMNEQTIAQRLKSLRDANKYSLRVVAFGVGKSAATVLRWENGESDPSRADFIKLAEFYAQDAIWLQWGTRPKSEEQRTKSIISKLPLLSYAQLEHVDELIDLLVTKAKDGKGDNRK